MKKKFVAVALSGAMLLTACSSAGDPTKVTTPENETQTENVTKEESKDEAEQEPEEVATEEGTVLYSNGGPQEFFEAPWLNPGTFLYNRVLFDRLIQADENLQPVMGEGQLAETFTLSEDGLQIEFVLRDGIKWHDGEPITTQDVKWSIEYALQSPALNPVFRTTFESIESIETTDNTITVKFSKLAPDALLTFSQFSPLPEKYFEGVDPTVMQQADFFQNPVGSGPFKVSEVHMNNYTILEANTEYWDGVAEYSIHLNPSAGDSDPNFVTNALAGKLDYGYTKNIAEVQALENEEHINIEKIDVRYTRLFFLNKFDGQDGTTSPLADVKVRQALRYALDMQNILDGIFFGAAVDANSLNPEQLSDGLNDYAYNPELAKELLVEAGWDPNTEIDLVYYYTDQQTIDFLTIIQHYWSQVGVKMNFRLVEGDLASILWSAPEDAVNGPSAVDWDIAYGATAALSLHEYYDRYQTGNAINSHTPSDPELDTLIAATSATLDPEATKEAFKELQIYENEELFAMPLYYQPVFVMTSDKVVEGAPAQGNPQFNYNWDIQNWDLE